MYLNYFSKSIDKIRVCRYTNKVLATIAQLAEHLIRNERVVGSNPISGSRKYAGSRNREPVFLYKNLHFGPYLGLITKCITYAAPFFETSSILLAAILSMDCNVSA